MAQVRSYKQLVILLEDIQRRHPNIHTFKEGEFSDFGEDGSIIYPALKVNIVPEESSMPRNDYAEYPTIILAVNLQMLDQLMPAEENRVDTRSDMIRLMQDVINELTSHPYYQRSKITILNDINFERYYRISDDNNAGVGVTLNFQLTNDNSWCGLPFEDITGFSANGPVSTGYSQSTTFATIAYVDSEIAEAISGLTSGITATGAYLNLSGGTVTGNTTFTSGLTITYDSGFTYNQGSNLAGKVLMADSNGIGTWQSLPSIGQNTYMFTSGASSISTYYQAVPTTQYDQSASPFIITTNVTTSPTLMGSFATNAGYPNASLLLEGNYHVHFETEKAAGSNNYFTFWELYKRNTSGVETFILSSDTSSESASNNIIQNELDGYLLSAQTIDQTDRMVIKIYGQMLSSSANIDLLVDNGTLSRFELPSSSIDTSTFVPYSGATGSVNLGNYNISATTIWSYNDPWTIELIDSLTTSFYAPYAMAINSYTNILGSPVINLLDDDVAYTTGDTISIGSRISVSGSTTGVTILNAVRL